MNPGSEPHRSGRRDAAPASPDPALRVLLADNDKNVAAILRAFLERNGLVVESVGDGQAALDRLSQRDVALLICDLDMPVLSGDAVLDALRDDPACPPVVVISGYVDDVSAARLAGHAAVREILRKPFDVRAFAARAAELARCGNTPHVAEDGWF